MGDRTEIREHGITTVEIHRMANGIEVVGCRMTTMESRESCWMPVWNIQEERRDSPDAR